MSRDSKLKTGENNISKTSVEGSVVTTNESNTVDNYIFSDFDTLITKRKIINLNDLPTIELLENDSPLIKSYSDSIRTSKAMLWHVRMGYALVNYLRKLQSL